MTDGRSASEQTRNRLERLVRKASLTLAWERLWPPLAGLISVVVLFFTVSWFGLWDVLPHPARIAGIVIFAALLGLACWPFTRLRLPGRDAALTRVDRATGVPHRPATALDDRIASASEDPFTRALWSAHRARAEEAAANLRVPAPSPRLDLIDPRAFRFLLALVAVVAFFVGGPDRGERVAAAFDWRAPAEERAPPRVDAWVAPPAYTGRPPIFLGATAEAGALSVPVGSTILVRASGGEVKTEPTGQVVVDDGEEDVKEGAEAGATTPKPVQIAGAASGSSEHRFIVDGDGSLSVSAAGIPDRRWIFTAVPDLPPTIALKGAPAPSRRGGLSIGYTVSDDYGIARAEALYEPIARPEAKEPPRPLYDAPKTALALPQARARAGEATTQLESTDHPWAGGSVETTLVVTDEAGQEGRSETVTIELPGRAFTNPLARALVEQRRNLAFDANARDQVSEALDALAMFPEAFSVDSSVYLGLRTAYWRLGQAKDDDGLRDVADYLWEMALQIEDGDLTDVEKQLRAAQEALKDALDRGASDEEIKRLTENLRQAMNDFMREMARRMPEAQQDARGMDPNQRVMRPQDLQDMLDRMQQQAQRGDRDAARDTLAELNQMLNAMRNAQRMPRNPNAQAMSRMLDELGDMIRQQNELRDRTFREGRVENGDPSRRNPQRGQRGQNQRGQQRGQQPGQQPGDQPGEGDMGDLAEMQRQLRQRLEQLQRQMQQRGMDGEAMGEAGGEMQGAEGSLGSGEAGTAVDQQGRALEALRRGARALANQMAGQGQEGGEPGGEGQPDGPRASGELDTDPLGRPTRSRTYDSGNSVRVPGEIDAQRARRVLEDIRRRLSEPSRPQEELDYLERLLEQ